MKITLDIPDIIWADYIAYVEDEHGKCKCKGNPERHLPQLLATFLVNYKTESLLAAHHEQVHERGDKKEITREHTYGPKLSANEEEVIEDWHNEYSAILANHLKK
jgi:hypothetical protein